MGRKKGTVEFVETASDDFNPSNSFKDPVAKLEMREHIVREKWIDIKMAKISTIASTIVNQGPKNPFF
ncbi:hypothetical protein Dsin_001294 [Dipteronia sinensis]|uniref:Uncharacterized protein n=1 Tax=Dipteronia sinensis TaxID=43782 RepID=A0AAE0B4H9_9ROSI|nr:hypothetical protein Dsin_001294 [Dipteronia sinensis]